MRFTRLIILAACLHLGLSFLSSAQAGSEMRQLMAELQHEKTCVQAAASIRGIASRDKEARRIVVSKVPNIIENSQGLVRFNAVDLAGDLKIDLAVPELVKMLKDPMTESGATSFGRHARLGDDPPGYALASIGTPAIQAVKTLLNDPDRELRIRAILVLANMNLPGANAVLEEQIRNEPDKDVRKFIESRVAARQLPNPD
jgi:hypothetical protein